MNVAMISYHTCPLATLGGKDTGGMNVYVQQLTRHLGALGVHVDVFTRSQDEHVPHVLHDLGYGNRVVHVPAGPETPLPKDELAAHLDEFTAGIQAFCASKQQRYDLIHSHYWQSGIAGLQLKAAWQVPMIHMFHTLGAMKQRIARLPGEAEGEYRLEGERRVLREADRIVAATPAELAQLQWLYGADTRKITIIPPGVDTSHFYPIPPDEAREYVGAPPCHRMLLFVGRIEPLKGIDNLIDAIAMMREAGVFNLEPVCLAVIGGEAVDDPGQISAEMQRLQELRAAHGLGDMITFLGRRGQDTLPYYYSAAEVVVMPSHYESFGMVALEAMACGRPVVASHVGGLAFLVQDGVTGFTVPVDEPEALADRLTRLLQDHALRQQMGQNATHFAANYAWEKITARIHSLYQETLASASSSPAPAVSASAL